MATIEGGVLRRYAEAAFSLAQQGGETDAVQAELERAAELIGADRRLNGLLRHPEIPLERKYRALDEALGAWARPTVVRLIRLLVKRGRHRGLPSVTQAFGELADEARGLIRARVQTAAPMADTQAERLRRALEQLTGRRVVMEAGVDPNLLAGGWVRIGDRLIDGSALSALTRLRERLL